MKRQLNLWFKNNPTASVYLMPQGWTVHDGFLFIHMGATDVHAFNLSLIDRFEYEEDRPCEPSSVA